MRIPVVVEAASAKYTPCHARFQHHTHVLDLHVSSRSYGICRSGKKHVPHAPVSNLARSNYVSFGAARTSSDLFGSDTRSKQAIPRTFGRLDSSRRINLVAEPKDPKPLGIRPPRAAYKLLLLGSGTHRASKKEGVLRTVASHMCDLRERAPNIADNLMRPIWETRAQSNWTRDEVDVSVCEFLF